MNNETKIRLVVMGVVALMVLGAWYYWTIIQNSGQFKVTDEFRMTISCVDPWQNCTWATAVQNNSNVQMKVTSLSYNCYDYVTEVRCDLLIDMVRLEKR